MKTNFLKELYKPSEELYNKILNRISNEKSIVAMRKRLIFTSFVFAFSVSCFVLSGLFFLSAVSKSGFFQMFSLIFSDFKVISSYSTSFILSLLESLPIFNIILSLVMVLFVSFVAKFLTKDIKNLVFYTHIKY